MSIPIHVAGALVFSGGFGGAVNVALWAVKEALMSEESVRYVRGSQFAEFTRVGNELRESWDGRSHRVIFRSALVEDQVLRMEHRHEVLTRQGFVAQRPWRDLFPLDAVMPED